MTREPIEQILEPSIDEARIASAWQQIRQARGDRRHAHVARWSIGLAVAGAAVALYVAWPAPQAGPLTSNGVALAAGAVLEAPAVDLDDRSRLELARGARLAVLANEGDRFETQLEHGRAHFDVQPGGPRRWEVETDLATVEVVGTAFSVEASDQRVVVEVERGVVMVRGERVPGRVTRLTAGQHVIIEAGPKTAASGSTGATGSSDATGSSGAMGSSASAGTTTSSGTVATSGSAGAMSSSGTVATSGSAGAMTSSGDTHHAHGSSVHATQHATTRHAGEPPATRPPVQASDVRHARTIGEALDAADRLRSAGDAAGAAAELERVLESARRDEAAGMAAFTLGRIYLEDLRAPDRAASAFEQMIAIGVPYGLLEDAHARRIEALVRAGRTDDATSALAEYDRLYPRGAHHTAVHALFAR